MNSVRSDANDLFRLAKGITPMGFGSLGTGMHVRELLENNPPEVAVQVANAIRDVIYDEKNRPDSLMRQDSNYVRPILDLIERKFKELDLLYMLDVKTLSDGGTVNIPVPMN